MAPRLACLLPREVRPALLLNLLMAAALSLLHEAGPDRGELASLRVPSTWAHRTVSSTGAAGTCMIVVSSPRIEKRDDRTYHAHAICACMAKMSPFRGT